MTTMLLYYIHIKMVITYQQILNTKIQDKDTADTDESLFLS